MKRGIDVFTWVFALSRCFSLFVFRIIHYLLQSAVKICFRSKVSSKFEINVDDGDKGNIYEKKRMSGIRNCLTFVIVCNCHLIEMVRFLSIHISATCLLRQYIVVASNDFSQFHSYCQSICFNSSIPFSWFHSCTIDRDFIHSSAQSTVNLTEAVL